jgi:hypothetical protein
MSHYLTSCRHIYNSSVFNTFNFHYKIWWQTVKIFKSGRCEWRLWVVDFCMMPFSMSGTVWCFVMYNGDKVLGHVDGVSPVHFVACSVQDFIWGVHFGWTVVWVLSPDRRSQQPKTCDCWQTHWWRCNVRGWGECGCAWSLHSPYTRG